MTVSRAGILVDYPHIDYLETELTVAQSEAMNNRRISAIIPQRSSTGPRGG